VTRQRYPDDSDGALWAMVLTVLWLLAVAAIAVAVGVWIVRP
jgi:hypothetical protein